MVDGRSTFKNLTGMRLLERRKHRREDTIRTDLKEIGINTRSWIDSALGRDHLRAPVSAALNLRVA